MNRPSTSVAPHDHTVESTSRTIGWILIAAMLATLPLTLVLPQWIGYENGVLEDVQAFTLVFGALACGMYIHHFKTLRLRHFWWAILPFWLAFIGRELAWGASFLPAISANEWGPTISSRILWYKPFVTPVLCAALVFSLWQFFRYRMDRAVLLRLWKENALPWRELAIFTIAMVASTLVEGHGPFNLQPYFGTQVVVLEELVETWGYLALFVAQWRIGAHMQQWRIHA